jgi:pilus assembly protein Flp/PilA
MSLITATKNVARRASVAPAVHRASVRCPRCVRASLSLLRGLLRGSDGTTSVEYAVMLAMIIAAVISAIGAVGGQSGGMWGNIQAALNTAGFGS